MIYIIFILIKPYTEPSCGWGKVTLEVRTPVISLEEHCGEP